MKSMTGSLWIPSGSQNERSHSYFFISSVLQIIVILEPSYLSEFYKFAVFILDTDLVI